MSKILEFVLAAAPFAEGDWWAGTRATRAQFGQSIDRAAALGALSDRLGYAFLGGYTSAITALDPSLGPDARGALCATEAGGGHPRAILTTLESGRLNGTKHFVSGGDLATVLLVVAKTGEGAGRPALGVARIRPSQAGVTREQGAPLEFIPEVSHCQVTFKDALVDAVLGGDGYEQYLKPFRTIEDLHVFVAALGCLIANGRSALAQATTQQLLGALAALLHLGREDPRSPAVHLALAGALTTAQAVIDSVDLTRLASEFQARFLRDRPLLQVAQRARELRRLKAWESVSAPLEKREKAGER